MEKMVVVINPSQFDAHPVEFACSVAKSEGSVLTGLFVESEYQNYVSLPLEVPYFPATEAYMERTTKMDVAQGIRLFKETCQKNGVQYHILKDFGDPLEEVIKESRFADLVILDPSLDFYDRKEESLSGFTKNLLSKSECPILIAPRKFEEINEITFCYDGSASSIYAIKQFTYLFPNFRSKNALLLEVITTSETNPDRRKTMDLLEAHYPTVTYRSIEGDTKETLFSYFFMRRNRFIVLGAYGRGFLSRLLKPSTADILLNSVDLPIFITHI